MNQNNPLAMLTEPDSLLDALDHCPPFLVYYGYHLLQAGGQRMTVQALVERSGLTLRTLTRTAHRHSWAGVKVAVMDKFCRACGIDPMQELDGEQLRAAVGTELAKPTPFPELQKHRRKAMLKAFNLLCAKAALGKAA